MINRKIAVGMLLFFASFLFLIADFAVALDKPTPPKDFPKRSIEYTVRWAAGGGAVNYANHFAVTVKKYLGLDVRVVSMPGAGGITAFNAFMEKPPDGYSILNTDLHLIIGTLLKKTKYSIFDLMNVCRCQQDISVLVIKANDPRFPNFDAMLNYAKKNPNKLTISSPDAGGMGDVILKKLEMVGGFTAKHVPYAAFGERVAVVLGGHADVVFEEAADMIPYIKDGKMTPIFVMLKERLKREPYATTPCSGEYGWDHDLAIWRGIGVKKGTPVDRARYIEKVFEFYHNTPEGKTFEKDNFLDVRRGYVPWDEHEKVIQGEMKVFKETMEKVGMLKAQ